jgi:hypothetical protein
MYVAICGNLTEGFCVVGPYADFDDAALAHDGSDVWITDLVTPAQWHKGGTIRVSTLPTPGGGP